MNFSKTDRFGYSDEERKELYERIEAANKEAYENWDNAQWRKEMAADMTETIYRGFQHENLLSLLAEVENVPFDGRSFVRETRGLRAFWVARGGYIEASTIHSEVMEIPRDTVGFHVNEFEDKLMTNFAETQSSLIDLGIQRLDAVVNQRVLAAFEAATPSTGSYYVSGAGVSLTALNTALRAVRDASRQQEVAIVGRGTMVDSIIDALTQTNTFAGFIANTNEEMVRTGVLGTYRGAKIVSLVNYLDDTDVPFFPNNEMFVVARDASKFAFFGGLMSKEYVEDDAWYWHYLARRDFGGVVTRPDRIRRFIDTSITSDASTVSEDSFQAA